MWLIARAMPALAHTAARLAVFFGVRLCAWSCLHIHCRAEHCHRHRPSLLSRCSPFSLRFKRLLGLNVQLGIESVACVCDVVWFINLLPYHRDTS